MKVFNATDKQRGSYSSLSSPSNKGGERQVFNATKNQVITNDYYTRIEKEEEDRRNSASGALDKYNTLVEGFNGFSSSLTNYTKNGSTDSFGDNGWLGLKHDNAKYVSQASEILDDFQKNEQTYRDYIDGYDDVVKALQGIKDGTVDVEGQKYSISDFIGDVASLRDKGLNKQMPSASESIDSYIDEARENGETLPAPGSLEGILNGNRKNESGTSLPVNLSNLTPSQVDYFIKRNEAQHNVDAALNGYLTPGEKTPLQKLNEYNGIVNPSMQGEKTLPYFDNVTPRETEEKKDATDYLSAYVKASDETKKGKQWLETNSLGMTMPDTSDMARMKTSAMSDSEKARYDAEQKDLKDKTNKVIEDAYSEGADIFGGAKLKVGMDRMNEEMNAIPINNQMELGESEIAKINSTFGVIDNTVAAYEGKDKELTSSEREILKGYNEKLDSIISDPSASATEKSLAKTYKEKIKPLLLYSDDSYYFIASGYAGAFQYFGGYAAAAMPILDLVTNGNISKDFAKIEAFKESNPEEFAALNSPFNNPLFNREEILKKIGVDSGVYDYYVFTNASRNITEDLQSHGYGVGGTGWKKWLGEQTTSLVNMALMILTVGAASGAASEAASIQEMITTAIGEAESMTAKEATKHIMKAVGTGFANAAKGNATTIAMGISAGGNKAAENASKYGDQGNTQILFNHLDAMWNGYVESFSEGTFGTATGYGVGKFVTSGSSNKWTAMGKLLLNAVISNVGEGMEEVINEPLQGIVDKWLTERDKKWVGEGGVFDVGQMANAFAGGVFMGVVLGGVANVAQASAVLKSDATFSESNFADIEDLGKAISDEENGLPTTPANIKLAAKIVNDTIRSVKETNVQFAPEELDIANCSMTEVEQKIAETLTALENVKNYAYVENANELVLQGLEFGEGTESYKLAKKILSKMSEGKSVQYEELVPLIKANAALVKEELLAEFNAKSGGNVNVINAVKNASLSSDAEIIESPKETVATAERKLSAVSENTQTEEKSVEQAETEKRVDGGITAKDAYIDNERVKVGDVVGIENGKSVISLGEGRVAFASDLTFTNTKDRILYDHTSGMSAEAANTMLRGAEKIKGGNEAMTLYSSEAKTAYLMGKSGVRQSAKAFNLEGYRYKENAIDMNSVGYREYLESLNNKEKTIKAKQIAKGKSVGTFDMSKVVHTEKVTTALKDICSVFNLAGINVELVEDGTGKYGAYSGKRNKLTINVNAWERYGMGAILSWTLGHESVHIIRKWNPRGFSDMVEYTIENVGASVFQNNLTDQLNKVTKQHPKWTFEKCFDVAVEECIAESFDDCFGTSEGFAEFAKDHMETARKLRDVIADFINMIKEALATFKNGARSELSKTLKWCEEKQKLFDKGLKQALENSHMTIGELDPTGDFFEKAVNENGEQLFQVDAFVQDEDIYKDMLRKRCGWSEEQIDELFTTLDTVVETIYENREKLDYSWDVEIKSNKETWTQLQNKLEQQEKATTKEEKQRLKEEIDSLRARLFAVADEDRAFSPFKKNADPIYEISLDFSTLCRKRLLQQIIQEELQTMLNTQLTREESAHIRNELIAIREQGYQIEVACGLCYVESARMKSPKQIEKFMNTRRTVLHDYFARQDATIKQQMKDAEIRKRGELSKKYGDTMVDKNGDPITDWYTVSLKLMPTKIAQSVRDAKKSPIVKYKLTAEQEKEIAAAEKMSYSDFTSMDGIGRLIKEHREVYAAYTEYIRNATKSKGLESDVWYRAGDSERYAQSLFDKMGAQNGTRSQSWSDFQVMHLIDYIAATIELSSRGAKEQVYTKVPDFVRLMGRTNALINMSLIPKAEYNGSLEYDSYEGMPFDTALALREKYPESAGTICIGINPAQIKQLLASWDIDQVIGYHKSGMQKGVAKIIKIPEWVGHEGVQEDKAVKTKSEAEANAKRISQLIGEKVVVKYDDENYHKATSFSDWYSYKEAQAFVDAHKEEYESRDGNIMAAGYEAMRLQARKYLKLCGERGLIPKFSVGEKNYSGEANYWKTLTDRKMINNVTGDMIEQKALTPSFSLEDLNGILEHELDNYANVKAAEDYAMRTVINKFLSGEMNKQLSKNNKQKVKEYQERLEGGLIAQTEDSDTVMQMDDYSPEFSNPTAEDNEYLEAVKNGDLEKAQSIIDSIAKEKGYDTTLYHGTTHFGFTRIDVENNSDDHYSFWTTNDINTASTYSGVNGERAISDRDNNSSDNDSIKLQYAKAIGADVNSLKLVEDRNSPKFFDDAKWIISAAMFNITQAQPDFIKQKYKEFFDEAKRLVVDKMPSAEEMNQFIKMVDSLIEKLSDETSGYEQYGGFYNANAEELVFLESLNILDNEQIYGYKVIQQENVDFYIVNFKNFGVVPGDAVKAVLDVGIKNVRNYGNYKLYAKVEDFVKFDAKGANWNHIYIEEIDDYMTTRDLSDFAYGNNMGDGVVIKNCKDSGGRGNHSGDVNLNGDLYIFFDPNRQIKSGDVKTYDDDGYLIPPSQRFNEENDDIRWQQDTDESHIKVQIKNHLDELSKMDNVDVINYTVVNKNKTLKDLKLKYKEKGYEISRQNGDNIIVAEKQASEIIRYVKETDIMLQAALMATPRVLKRGKIIYSEELHKNTGKSSKTIAAPALINGVRCYIGCVVQKSGKSKLHSVRIIIPENGITEQKEKSTDAAKDSMTETEGNSQRLSDSSVLSKGSITQNDYESQDLDERNQFEADPLVESLQKTVRNEEEQNALDRYAYQEFELWKLRRQEQENKNKIYDMTFGDLEYNSDVVERLRQENVRLDGRIKRIESELLRLSAADPFKDLVTRAARTGRNKAMEEYQGRVRQKQITDEKNKIVKLKAELDRKLNNPRESSYVPRGLVSGVANILENLDMRTVDIAKKLEAYQDELEDIDAQLEGEKDTEKIKQLQTRLQNLEARPDGKYKEQQIKYVKRRLEGEKDAARRERLLTRQIELLNLINVAISKEEQFGIALKTFQQKYNELKTDERYGASFDQDVADLIERVANVNKPLYSMSLEELEDVTKMLRIVKHVIVTSAKLQATSVTGFDTMTIGEIDNEIIKAIRSRQDNKVFKGTLMGAENKVQQTAYNAVNFLESLFENQLSPRVVFDKIGNYSKNNMMLRLYEMLDEAQLKELTIACQVDAMFEKFFNDKEFKKLVSTKEKDLVDIGLSDVEGKPIMLTRGMMLSVYLDLLNQDNRDHVFVGGYSVPNLFEYYNGSKSDAYSAKRRMKGTSSELAEIVARQKSLMEQIEEAIAKGDGARRSELDAQLRETYTMAAEFREKAEMETTRIKEFIEKSMTPFEKKYVKAVQDFMDVYSKEKINETTMEIYGFEKARVEHYYPIITDPNFLSMQVNEQLTKDANLENMGMLKDRVHASNPILLKDITDVVNMQKNRVARYCGLMPAIRNYNKLMGLRSTDYSDTVSEALDNVYGEKARTYIERIIADLQGESRKQKSTLKFIDKMLGKLRGNMARATLTTNLRVSLVQAASYPTAGAVVGSKALVKGLALGDKKTYFKGEDRLSDFVLLAYRSKGFNLVEMGEMTSKGDTVDNIFSKLKFITGWINFMDTKTVGRLCYAAEYYVQDNMNLEFGSEEYQKAVIKVFNDIVEKTQPNYTVMQRPELLRNSDNLIRSLAMFMTQRLQNFSLMYEAVAKYSKMQSDFKNNVNGVNAQDVKESASYARRVMASQLAATVTVTVIKFVADALLSGLKNYRDKDKELSFESVMLGIADSFMDTCAGTVLFGSDIYSMVKSLITDSKYYGMSLSGVSSFLEFGKNSATYIGDMFKGDFDLKKDGVKMANEIATILGIPAKNCETIVTAIYKHVVDAKNGNVLSLDAFMPETTNTQDADRLYTATLKGDKKKIENITEGRDEKEIQNLYKNALKNNDERIVEAALDRLKGKTGDYADLVDAVAKDGFDRNVVIGAINSVISTINSASSNAKAAQEEGNDKDYNDELKKMTDLGIPRNVAERFIRDAEASAPSGASEYSLFSKQDAFLNYEDGDVEEGNMVIESMYEDKVDNNLEKHKADKDYTEEDARKSAKSSIRSTMTGLYKTLYIAGDDKERERIADILLNLQLDGAYVYEAERKKLEKGKDPFEAWLK